MHTPRTRLLVPLGLLGAGVASGAVLMAVHGVVVGPVWTPHLFAAAGITSAVLLSVSLVRVSQALRNGDDASWRTLVADGVAALGLIGALLAVLASSAAAWLWSTASIIVETPGAAVAKQVHDGWRPSWAPGSRWGPVVVWGPEERLR